MFSNVEIGITIVGTAIVLACIVALIWKYCDRRRESEHGDPIFIPTDGQKESPTEQHVNCGKEEFVVNF